MRGGPTANFPSHPRSKSGPDGLRFGPEVPLDQHAGRGTEGPTPVISISFFSSGL